MTVIEDFENGSLPSHYVGERAGITIESSATWNGKEGTYYAESPGRTVTTTDTIISPGDTPIEAAFDATGYCSLIFGVETTGGDSSFSGYEIFATSSYLILYKVTDGVKNSLSVVGHYPSSPFTIRVTDWDSNGYIRAESVTTTGTQLGAVSSSDGTYGSGGYGFRVDGRIDNIQANVSLSTSQAASLDVANVSTTALSPSVSTPTTSTGDVTRALESKWKFDSDYTDSVGIYDATNSGASLISGGYIDGAAQFDGSSYIDAGDHSTIDSAPWTVAVRAYLTTTTSGTADIQSIATKNLDNSDRGFWLVEWDGKYVVRVGSNSVTVTGPTPTLNTWQTLVLTYDGNTFELWVDGTSYGTNTESTIGGQSYPIRFGSESGSTRFLKSGARVDDARVYSAVLADQEIADLTDYDGTATSPSQSAVLGVGPLVATPRTVEPVSGPTSASVSGSLLTATAPSPSGSSGGVGVSTDIGVVSVSGNSWATQAGSVSEVISVGQLASSGRVLGSGATVSVSVDTGQLSVLGSSLETFIGFSALIEPGSLAVSGVDSTAAGGSVEASALGGDLSLTNPPPDATPGVVSPVVAPGSVSVLGTDLASISGNGAVLSAGSVLVSGGSPGADPGPVDSISDSGTVSISGMDLSAFFSLSAALTPGSTVLSGTEPGLVLGETAALAGSGSISISVSDVSTESAVSGLLESGKLGVEGVGYGSAVGSVVSSVDGTALTLSAPVFEAESKEIAWQIIKLTGRLDLEVPIHGVENSTRTLLGVEDTTRPTTGTKL